MAPLRRLEPEQSRYIDFSAVERNVIRSAFPTLKEDEVRQVAAVYDDVSNRSEFIDEMQKKPFEERLLGFVQRAFARPLRQDAGERILGWNEVVKDVAASHPELPDLTLQYGHRVDGASIKEVVTEVETRAQAAGYHRPEHSYDPLKTVSWL